MTSASACTAHGNVAQYDVGLACAVEGAGLLKPEMSNAAVCAEFQTKIEAALARKTIAVNSTAGAESVDWIKIDVRFSKPSTASAMVVQRTGGKQTDHPEIAVDVMDKAIGSSDVATLATEVAKFIAQTAKN